MAKDIFRRYPNRYESLIKELCEHLKQLDREDSRSAMVWIVGEYCDRIDNSVSIMSGFGQGFVDESRKVQLSILTACVKMYLKLGDPAEELVMKVLEQATEEGDNPDLRNRAYIYWRMLS